MWVRPGRESAPQPAQRGGAILAEIDERADRELPGQHHGGRGRSPFAFGEQGVHIGRPILGVDPRVRPFGGVLYQCRTTLGIARA